ncbi:MAG TPA: zf-HC2 domain-containing protein [Polyangiaceae bacterium]|jgi:anti-sigma factor RsiW
MDCREARTHLVDRRRGTIDVASGVELDAHLAGCDACRHEEAADAKLSDILEERLPRLRAPASLRRSLEARWDRPSAPRVPRVARSLATMAAGAALAVLVLLAWRSRSPHDPMLTEAVNDHLRVLYSEHPVEVQSGGIHQVKPWFEGRLDFAPVVPFAGDEDFPLQGGAVAYFLDRKAATFVYKRRLHLITLFVFRAEGMPWPAIETLSVGDARGTMGSSRGFHALLWRKGDLGYALVSDVDPKELETLAGKVAGGG